MEIDYLIIGQGLAGSLLGWALIQQQRKVIIVDNGVENASKIAAGIINPITGPRLVKTADIETLLWDANHCYAALSQAFQQAFYIQQPMLRIFRDTGEAKIASKRLNDSSYHAYLDAILSPATNPLNTPFGSVTQKQTGYLLTSALLSHLRAFFSAQGCYRQTVFNYSDLKLQPKLRWQDLTPQRIIFCEGYQQIHNPWFSWLPLQPVKGEILTLRSAVSLPDKLLNYGHWLQPLANQCFRLGATFDRDQINTLPSPPAAAELLHHLNAISPELALSPITQHQANIRPCSKDRQPMLGHHPDFTRLSVFNGFGAKGSLQIPWYAKQFTDHLLNGTPLGKVYDIQRFLTNHFHSA